MAGDDFDFLDQGSKKKTAAVDPKLIFFKIIRQWPILIIALMISLVAVYIFHRYTVEKYRLRSTLVIPDSNRSIDEGILDQFSFDFNPNFLNELEVFRSKGLTREAIQSLDFGISYTTKGRIKTIQEYKTLPFHVKLAPKMEHLMEKEFRISFVEGP